MAWVQHAGGRPSRSQSNWKRAETLPQGASHQGRPWRGFLFKDERVRSKVRLEVKCHPYAKVPWACGGQSLAAPGSPGAGGSGACLPQAACSF